MISGLFPQRFRPSRIAGAPALLSAVFAGIFSYLVTFHGMFMSPDSWVYWESSVQFVEGESYRNFLRPVWEWPPLYSLYLAGIQAAFGVSGFSLALSTIFLAVGSGFVWTYIFCSLCGKENGYVRFALALSNSALVSLMFRYVWSDNLSVFLIGVLLLVAVRFMLKQSSPPPLTASAGEYPATRCFLLSCSSPLYPPVCLYGMQTWLSFRQSGSGRSHFSKRGAGNT